MKIYISAPISGTSDYKERFEKAERSIEAKGHEAINPCKLDAILKPETTSWEQYMLADLGLLRACDAICVLNNWERSRGCRQEVEEAKRNGMKIYKGLDFVPRKDNNADTDNT